MAFYIKEGYALSDQIIEVFLPIVGRDSLQGVSAMDMFGLQFTYDGNGI